MRFFLIFAQGHPKLFSVYPSGDDVVEFLIPQITVIVNDLAEQ